MSVLQLTQSKTALAPSLNASFLGVGGSSHYAYSVLPGGAGGSINPTTGLYTAPATVQTDPLKNYDIIQVSDGASIATGAILVGTPLMLLCEILQIELGLTNDRVYFWDQKKFQFTDNGLYVIIGISECKPFGNNIKPDDTTGWANPVQSVNMLAKLDINIISRDTSALNRKEDVLFALNSSYSQKQQEANSFLIGRIPTGTKFMNLSFIDGAAIPYRFMFPINMQYAVTKTKAEDYIDTFVANQIETNS